MSPSVERPQPIAPQEADGLRCNLVLLREMPNQPDAFFEIHGTTRWDGTDLIFEHASGAFPLPTDALKRLRRLDPHADAANDADVFLMLTLGPLPPDRALDDLLATGLRIPDLE